ncbi:MAG TPA: hypothetical protein VGM66_01520 [Candidatus Udaeobacter sp.]|jgi:hypothetical protein
MKHATGKTLDLAVIVVAPTLVSNTRAGEIGHFNDGVMNIREYVMPDPGLYTAIYNYFYMTDQVNNSNGDAINSVIIKSGPGLFPTGGIPKVSAPTGK